MNNEKEHNKLVPDLRFPEFEGEWNEKNLYEVSEVNPSSNSLPNEFVYIDLESVDSGNLLKKRIIFLDNAPSRAQRLLKQGDTIFQMVRPYQRNNYFFNPTDNLKYVASTGYAQLRAFQSKRYLFQYIHNNDFVNRVLAKSTGSNYPAINSRDLAKIKVVIPKAPKEQQKIAATLTSLDHLIAAENENLEALQAHKKGLLQQLFPAKGEKVPKLRFGEFSGDWEETTLGEVCNYFKGFAFKSKDYTTSGRRVVRVSDMGYDYIKDVANAIFIREEDIELYDKWLLQKNDLIITTVGSKPPVYASLVGRSIIVNKKNENSLLNQNAVCIRANSNIEQSFLNTLFKRKDYISFVESIIRGNANQGSIALVDLFKYPICKPSPNEQSKIATCLSSLDEWIATQSEKIAALKEHKKGLMQQMFPNLNTQTK